MTRLVYVEEDNRWKGPCDDSFCFASCDSPHCRYQFRLGDTPSEHNRRVALNEIKDIEEKRFALQEHESQWRNK